MLLMTAEFSNIFNWSNTTWKHIPREKVLVPILVLTLGTKSKSELYDGS